MTFKRPSNALQSQIQTPFNRATYAHLILQTTFRLPSHTNPLTPLRGRAPLGSQHTRENQRRRAILATAARGRGWGRQGGLILCAEGRGTAWLPTRAAPRNRNKKLSGLAPPSGHGGRKSFRAAKGPNRMDWHGEIFLGWGEFRPF